VQSTDTSSTSHSVAVTSAHYDGSIVPELATVQQRLMMLDQQPPTLSNLYPRRKQLMTKLAKRCRTCQRFVIKPELNPSTKFTIHNSAMFFSATYQACQCDRASRWPAGRPRHDSLQPG